MSNQYIIDKAKEEDLKILQDIARRTIDQCYRSFLGDDGVDWYINSGESDKELEKYIKNCDVLIKDETIVAFTIYFLDFIHIMMVDVTHQRSGIGSFLLSHSEKQLFADNNEKLHLETFEGNQQAINFYLKNGWKIIRKEKDNEFDFIRVFFEKENNT